MHELETETPPEVGASVSVVLSTRNSGRDVADVLDGALSQAGVDVEVVVVDSGSTDDTVDVIRDYAGREPRVRWFCRPDEGSAEASAWDIGSRHATGEFIAPMDPREVWPKNKLAAQVGRLARTGAPVCTFALAATQQVASEKGAAEEVNRAAIHGRQLALRLLSGDTSLRPISPLYRRRVVERIGGASKDFARAHAFEICLRTLSLGTAELAPCTWVRRGAEDAPVDPLADLQALDARWRAALHHWPVLQRRYRLQLPEQLAVIANVAAWARQAGRFEQAKQLLMGCERLRPGWAAQQPLWHELAAMTTPPRRTAVATLSPAPDNRSQKPHMAIDPSFAELSEWPARHLLPPLDQADAVPEGASEEQSSWWRDGVVIKRAFLPEALMDAYCEVRARWPHRGGWACPVPYMHVKELRALACYPPLFRLLSQLIGDDMALHLNLTGWLSTERTWHQDDYLNPPFVNSWYAAVWMALEDIHPDSGPFEYVPGSHRWPLMRGDTVRARLPGYQAQSPRWPTYAEKVVTPAFDNQIALSGLPIKSFAARRGDLLVWHGRLAHRGAKPRVAGTQRKAVISHFSAVSKRPDMPAFVLTDQKVPFFPIQGFPLEAIPKPDPDFGAEWKCPV